jgi:polyphosphate kinase
MTIAMPQPSMLAPEERPTVPSPALPPETVGTPEPDGQQMDLLAPVTDPHPVTFLPADHDTLPEEASEPDRPTLIHLPIESEPSPQLELGFHLNHLNVELSVLAFHERVLAQATRTDVPLLERLRFLSISSTNLDEFFEVRVSSIKQQATYGVGYPGPDGRTPKDVLSEIARRAHALVDEQYRLLNHVLLPELAASGIRVLEPDVWTDEVRRWARLYFEHSVLPVLSATALDPAHPFPNIVNKRLNYIVELSGDDAFGRDAEIAIVPIPNPRALARVVHLPPELSGGPWDYVLLASVIESNIDLLFPGMTIRGAYQFRLTRNSDLWVDEEEVDDLLHAIAGELPRRNFGDAVRLEVDRWCPEALANFLLNEFELTSQDLYRTDGHVNLHRVSALAGEVALPHLKYPPFLAATPSRLQVETDIFAAIRAGDILLHHPYQSFQPVLELLRRGARDPDVLSIKMTLYRTGAGSPVADALIDAAQRGKDVTVVVELRARFDEEANIDLAQRLQAVGATVAYGVVGRKTHAKMLVVTRREGTRLRSYAHLGTGNYHSQTANFYTDIGLLTTDEALTADVHDLFRQLTGLGRLPPPRKLISAPFMLAEHLAAHIDAEIAAAREGREAWIRARMNSLGDPTLIEHLYRASQAGVQIDLVVRGICALRPGVPNQSERIRVRSIVGRFLEHSRVFSFCANGAHRLYIASADWLARNLRRRVETCVPIDDPHLKRRIAEETLDIYLADTVDAWELLADGTYRRIASAAGEPQIQAQSTLVSRYCDRR